MPRASSTRTFFAFCPLLFGASLTLLASPAAWAQDGSLNPTPAATEPQPQPSADASRWGLGMAAGVKQQPYTGAGTKTQGIPLIYYENRYVRVLGAGAELKLPEIELGSNSSLSFGLRAKYGLGGYEPSDAPILEGMQERKGSVWLGAGVTWHNEIADISAEWLGDASGKSKGQQFRLGVQRDFRAGSFTLTPRIAANWLDRKYVDYYYGVRTEESRPGRPAYLGASTVNTEIGLRVDYAIDRQQTVFVDVSATRLGKQIKNSPLVDRSSQTSLSVGYLYRF
ncbi:MipA/OmpV family protein [Variovorax beijingensis]|uniref:MipA/OmpV family protein n=1 Tax=Variovorax beijingensis TaxID=2496117 RepID=UPI003F6955CC